jgi:cytochrome c oxidase cbb3-type subunit IV
MDINDLRSAVTVLGLLLFLALVAWVYGARRRSAFEAAARLPFEGDSQAAEETRP